MQEHSPRTDAKKILRNRILKSTRSRDLRRSGNPKRIWVVNLRRGIDNRESFWGGGEKLFNP
jgi:hypothetical protein